MGSIWQTTFWKATAERAIKSAAQAMILTFGADQLLSVITVDWLEVGGFGAGGAVLSVLTSIVSSGVGPTSGPSLTGAEKVTPEPRDDSPRA